MGSLEVVVIKRWEELSNHISPARETWNMVLANAISPSIFQTYEWHESWCTSFEKNNELRIFLFFNNNELVGIGPFERIKESNNKHSYVFLGTSNKVSDYCDWIIDKDYIDDVLSAWLHHIKTMGDWDKVHLMNITSRSASLFPLLSLLKENHNHFYMTKICDAPTHRFNNAEEDQGLVNKKSLKRHYNYFKSNGTLVFKHLYDKNQIIAALDDYYEQHIQRKSTTPSPSQFCSTTMKEFFKQLVIYLPDKWLRFSVLLFNGKAIAYHFGFEFEGNYIWYVPSFDIQLAKHSPGEVLIRFLIEYCLEKDLKEFDFTIGDENYKYRFANEINSVFQMTIFKNKYDYLMQKGYSLFKSRVKQMLITMKLINK